MRDRSLLGALLLAAIAVVPITSCTTTASLTAIAVSPTAVTATPSFGLQNQFTAIGTYSRPGHAAITKDITNQVNWASATPQMVTVDQTGLATVTGAVIGNTTISASAQGFHGIIVGSATFTVQNPTTTGGVTGLAIGTSLRSLPTVGSTVQFTALGKTANGATAKLSGEPVWTSTDSEVATIDKATGVLTTLGGGHTTVIATYTNPDGTTAVGVTHLLVAGPEREQ